MSEHTEFQLKTIDGTEHTVPHTITEYCSFEPILKRGPKVKTQIPKFQTSLNDQQFKKLIEHIDLTHERQKMYNFPAPLQIYDFQKLVNEQDYTLYNSMSQNEIFELLNIASNVKCQYLMNILNVFIACQLRSNTFLEIHKKYQIEINENILTDENLKSEFEKK